MLYFYSPISYFVAQVAEIDVHGFWLCDIQLPSRECKMYVLCKIVAILWERNEGIGENLWSFFSG